ncbi:MAG: hypothetical protein K2K05_10760, partial [Muribaculaceae bacterium]|nr:hypothetical protein [Muribaculaceae bacterium]
MKKLLIYIGIMLLLPVLGAPMVSCGTMSRSGNSKHIHASLPAPVRERMAVDSLHVAADTLPTDAIPVVSDTLPIQPTDTLRSTAIDSIGGNEASAIIGSAMDSVHSDTVAFRPSEPTRKRIRNEKVDLDAAVQFSANDSMIILRRDSAMMYGGSKVNYGDIKVDAQEIEMNLKDNTVYAHGVTDSLGEVVGKPVFNDGDTDYEASTMRYNFKSGKGFITNVVTQQGEGYLTGGETKKNPDNSYNIKMGRYTTCDNHDCPHFYFQVTKGKMRTGKDIVVGPTYMVLAGLPLPLA